MKQLSNSGFLMFEMLIVITILSTIILLNVILYKVQKTNVYTKNEVILLESTLNKSKQLAISKKDKVSLKFIKNALIVIYDGKIEKLFFKSLEFYNSKELFFNAKGNINQAYTINFKENTNDRKLIFYLGRGWYRIE